MSHLRDVLAGKKISKTDKYLLIVASHDGPVPVKDIREIARLNGWKLGHAGSPSSHLTASRFAVSLPSGWEITGEGKAYLAQKGWLIEGVLTPVIRELEAYLAEVTDQERSAFIQEAVSCVRHNNLRAAIVLSWVGAVAILYRHVLAHKLREYNAEVNRQWKGKPAADIDDLATRKEVQFLDAIQQIGVITKAERKELGSCLERRNTAGHPNSHVFSEITVGSHIQELIQAVYRKF